MNKQKNISLLIILSIMIFIGITSYAEPLANASIKGYASWSKLTDHSQITITAKKGEDTIDSVVTNIDGLFELSLPSGTYNIIFTKLGYLERTIANVIIKNGDRINLDNIDNPITLWAGDVNRDESVNATDLSQLLAVFNKTNGVTGYDSAADFNGDESINATDLSKLLENFNKTTSNYPTVQVGETFSVVNIY